MRTSEYATTKQREADKFDLEIFRLISQAETNSADPYHRKLWLEAARYLNAARTPIRQMMHPKDVESTK